MDLFQSCVSGLMGRPWAVLRLWWLRSSLPKLDLPPCSAAPCGWWHVFPSDWWEQARLSQPSVSTEHCSDWSFLKWHVPVCGCHSRPALIYMMYLRTCFTLIIFYTLHIGEHFLYTNDFATWLPSQKQRCACYGLQAKFPLVFVQRRSQCGAVVLRLEFGSRIYRFIPGVPGSPAVYLGDLPRTFQASTFLCRNNNTTALSGHCGH